MILYLIFNDSKVSHEEGVGQRNSFLSNYISREWYSSRYISNTIEEDWYFLDIFEFYKVRLYRIGDEFA